MMIDENLAKLSSLLRLPEHPLGQVGSNLSSISNIDITYKGLESYIHYLNTYGSGVIIGPDLRIFSPNESHGRQLAEVYHEFSKPALRKFVGRIIPLGTSGCGHALYLTCATRSEQVLRILVVDEDWELWEFHEYEFSVFLRLYLSKQLDTILPIPLGIPPFEYESLCDQGFEDKP